jgi:two-component system chemotaxis sensor kinase CheA
LSTVDQNAAEFIAEAQEVIETFSRTLLELEAQSRTGGSDPELLNAAFRAIHSLKGLAGLFGASAIGNLSHTLENTLDGLRLGKLNLSRNVLDVLFEAIEVFGRLLMPQGDSSGDDIDIEPILGRLRALTDQAAPDQPLDNLDWIGDAILSVLTEYEEHRLRENIRSGRNLFRVHAKFDILAIDVGIEQLKDKMKAYGEVITYLPSADGSSDDSIELDILLGSKGSYTEISAALGVGDVSVFRLSPPEPVAPARAPEKPAPPPSRGAQTGAPPSRASEPGRSDPHRDHTPPPSSRPYPAVPVRPFIDAAMSTPTIAPPLSSPTPTLAPSDDSGAHEPITSAETSLRSLSQTVRVELRRLDDLMNLVGELGLVQNNLAGVLDALRELDKSADVSRGLQVQIRDMTRKLALLQQGILDVRMVPIGQVFDKLARIVRKVSRDLDKDIRLVISGAETVLDKLIVEELSDPLMHMIRNSIDHGIEPAPSAWPRARPPPAASSCARSRRATASSSRSRTTAAAWTGCASATSACAAASSAPRGGRLDDPVRGRQPHLRPRLLHPRVRHRAVRPRRRHGHRQDQHRQAVRHDRRRHRRRPRLPFSITLPVTLAIIQALVIQSAGHTFCIPLNSVLESIMVETREIGTIEGHEVITLRGKTLPLLHLSRLFALRPLNKGYRDPHRVYVVVVGLAQHRVGLVVDELLGQQDVVIKPLGSAVRNVPGIAGATELGANRTVLLLDVGRIVDEGVRQTDAGVAAGAAWPRRSCPLRKTT